METKLKFYTAWFCPFAQRVWMGLLEKGIQFDLIEVDPYDKSKEWLAISPKGLVPVLVHQGKSIFESSVCLEYLDEAFPDCGKKLLVGGPYDRARQRLMGDHITKKLLPPFYHLLMKPTQEERSEASKQILESVEKLVEEMHHEGPFFAGENLTFVDLLAAPMALRIEPILEHYRDFKIPENWNRYHLWLEAIKKHPSVTPTLANKEKLIAVYQRYADNSAKSEVANAVRSGGVLP